MAARHSISVKLSALHPRYEFAQRDRVLAELTPQLLTLVKLARTAGIGLTMTRRRPNVSSCRCYSSMRCWRAMPLSNTVVLDLQ